MVSVELWIGFALAAEIILVIPGPTILLVISQAVVCGRRSAVPLTAGVLAGDLTAMTLSVAGLGVLLAASSALFALFKWVGAVYLVFLGVRMWRSAPEGRNVSAVSPEPPTGRALFQSAFIVTASNPKSIAFFVAFLPQFVSPGLPALPQLVLYGGTFLLLAGVNAAAYAFFAGRLRELLRNRAMQKWFSRFGACALIGAGAITAGLRR